MSKKDVFANLKLLNAYIDKMESGKIDEESEEYAILADNVYWLADALMTSATWYTFHLSKRTGHYYIRF